MREFIKWPPCHARAFGLVLLKDNPDCICHRTPKHCAWLAIRPASPERIARSPQLAECELRHIDSKCHAKLFQAAYGPILPKFWTLVPNYWNASIQGTPPPLRNGEARKAVGPPTNRTIFGFDLPSKLSVRWVDATGKRLHAGPLRGAGWR